MPDEPQRYVLRREPLGTGESKYRIDYRSELNPAQYEAVTATTGAILVVAGAGTGKTRTLVYRVARLVESGVEPRAILLLTFTRRAAQEMLRRAAQLLDGRCEEVEGGTFHSFANKMLRRHGSHVGLHSGFTILDRGDGEDVINLLRAKFGLDKKERRFPRKQTIADLFSAVVNKGRTLADLIEEEHPHLIDHLEDLVALQTAYATYKAERQLANYDDLLVKLHELLANHPAIRDRLAATFRYVMVDEYQDTNRLQAEIVRLLVEPHGNVMAVGDDAQSIYSFRGANFRNIMDFPQIFPTARLIAIEENYRSTQPVLDLTNAVIAQARERHTKQLFSKKIDGLRPALIAAPTEHDQSRFICQRILDLREEGVPLDEIAVLFRSSFHAYDLELELTRHDIPFVKRGGFKFVETAHIKDTLAHLRILANPRDAVSWHRVLLLLEGVGPRMSEEILASVLAGDDMVAQLQAFPKRAVQAGLATLAGLLRRLRTLELPEAQLTEVVRYYEPILQRLHADDHPRRRKDLDHFIALATRYQSLEALLVDMALEPPTDSVGDVMAGGDEDEGLLTLSTVHSAKGLEWKSVFVIWLAEGRFPSAYNVEGDDVEEERRLLYVAATRAKEHLFLSYPIYIFDRGIGMVMAKPSRFLDGLASNLYQSVTLVEETEPWPD